MRRIAFFVTLVSASLAGAPTPARAQMDFEGEITSLTGAREAEMLATYAFARERPRMYAPVSLLHLPLSPYTEMDDEAPWSEVRVDAALQYTRYVFGHCGIVLDRGELQRAPQADMVFPNEKHLRGAGHGETLVYFVDDVPGRSIGFLDASRTKYPFPAARVQNGVPLLTVLPHLIGLRLDATVSAERSSMMLNDRTVQEAFGSALTGAAGFFDPRRFGFADDACNVMREALLRETQCYPRAYVYGGRGDDRWQRFTYPERRAARRADIPWPLGETPPDDLVVAPAFAQDGLIIFALQGDRWRGFFWRYDDPSHPDPTYAPRAEVYEGFAEPGALGLGVHPAGQDIRLLTFAEGTAVEVHSTPWRRHWPSKKAPRPVQTDRVPCRVMLTSGPVGKGAERPLAVVCNDKVWRLWKTRAPEAFTLPHKARWASMTRRCDDDAQLWLGVDDAPGGLELWRVPAYGPLEPEPLPAWAAWPAVREVPFSATWGGTPRSLDRVNIRKFDATQSPRWLPAVNEPTPTPVDASTQWVRYEDLHGPGWVGYVNGRLRVE